MISFPRHNAFIAALTEPAPYMVQILRGAQRGGVYVFVRVHARGGSPLAGKLPTVQKEEDDKDDVVKTTQEPHADLMYEIMDEIS